MNASRRVLAAGFTLVELMISMALGLLIILALITMLTNVSKNNNELGSSNRLIENGRFAAQLLASDLQHAGYWGGFVPNYDELAYTGAPLLASAGGQVPTALPDPCQAYDPVTWTDEYKANLLGIHVQSSDIPASLTKPFCSGIITDPKANTDVLVVRHVEPCTAGSGTGECAATDGLTLHFQMSYCGSDTSTYALGPAGFGLRTRECTTTVAPIRRFASNLYYVKSGTTPTLMRSVHGSAGGAAATQLAAQALVENVEGFRVEFGIDASSDTGGTVTLTAPIAWADAKNKKDPTNRGDGIPEGAFVHCTQTTPCSADQMTNAVAAKVYVLVRAERATPGYQDTKTYNMGSTTMGPFNDAYKRHLFSQTVRLMNVSGRRETP
jgi:type IV pilus assembly protein PilW